MPHRGQGRVAGRKNRPAICADSLSVNCTFTVTLSNCTGKLTSVFLPSLAVTGAPIVPNLPKLRTSAPGRSRRNCGVNVCLALGAAKALSSAYFSASK